jgi:hypothetical protein
MPVQASHHMAKVPGFTTSRSISSLSQVPHCGKVLRTQDSLVISSTFANFFSSLLFRFPSRATNANDQFDLNIKINPIIMSIHKHLNRHFDLFHLLLRKIKSVQGDARRGQHA